MSPSRDLGEHMRHQSGVTVRRRRFSGVVRQASDCSRRRIESRCSRHTQACHASRPHSDGFLPVRFDANRTGPAPSSAGGNMCAIMCRTTENTKNTVSARLGALIELESLCMRGLSDLSGLCGLFPKISAFFLLPALEISEKRAILNVVSLEVIDFPVCLRFCHISGFFDPGVQIVISPDSPAAGIVSVVSLIVSGNFEKKRVFFGKSFWKTRFVHLQSYIVFRK